MSAPTPDPAKRALLSCLPGITGHMWEIRVRNGQWDDIPAAWDRAYTNVHQPARAAQRNIHRDLRTASRQMAVAFDRNPDWYYHKGIAEGLGRLAESLEGQLAAMRQQATERALEAAKEEAA